MEQLSIRKATADDSCLINKLAWDVFPATYKSILSQEQIDYMMEWMYSPDSLKRQMTAEGHVYLLAYSGGSCVGYVSVRPDGEDTFHLEKIYVRPEMQGTGCGKFLFNNAVAYIRSVHPTPCTVELNVNRYNPALGFYLHLGMKKVRQGDFAIGGGFYMNDYIMALRID